LKRSAIASGSVLASVTLSTCDVTVTSSVVSFTVVACVSLVTEKHTLVVVIILIIIIIIIITVTDDKCLQQKLSRTVNVSLHLMRQKPVWKLKSFRPTK